LAGTRETAKQLNIQKIPAISTYLFPLQFGNNKIAVSLYLLEERQEHGLLKNRFEAN
jgi:hypothetical protein